MLQRGPRAVEVALPEEERAELPHFHNSGG
jgi:hypothetical protein